MAEKEGRGGVRDDEKAGHFYTSSLWLLATKNDVCDTYLHIGCHDAPHAFFFTKKIQTQITVGSTLPLTLWYVLVSVLTLWNDGCYNPIFDSRL